MQCTCLFTPRYGDGSIGTALYGGGNGCNDDEGTDGGDGTGGNDRGTGRDGDDKDDATVRGMTTGVARKTF